MIKNTKNKPALPSIKGSKLTATHDAKRGYALLVKILEGRCLNLTTELKLYHSLIDHGKFF